MTDVLDLAHRHHVPVIVDPKVPHISRYKGATVITPNHLEAIQAAGVQGEDEASLLEAGRQLFQRLGCQAILITRGERGMSLFEEDGRVTHIPTLARQVFDVTGARSEEHTSELQSRLHLVCRLLLEKKKKIIIVSS